MKIFSLISLLSLLLSLSTHLFAEDVANGWSISTKIESVSNDADYDYFKLTGQTDGCGHTELWSLPADGSSTNEAILSLLLLANADGNEVTLKCENGVITDFDIAT